MPAILLLSAFIANAQLAMPDYVYLGSQKHYNVDLITGSTYTWKIDGVEQAAKANEIDITWNTPFPLPHILSVQIQSSDGCPGPFQTGEVYVYQVTLPDPLIECVENIHTATYDAVTNETVVERPDYYIFKSGDVSLDLNPFNFADVFPSSCPIEIQWKIDFSPTPDSMPPYNTVIKPPVSGTGQPSKITGNILLPGDGANFSNTVHTITYQIVDCNGQISYTKSQTITIKPRPKIL
jgi:hypothetical protein